MKERQVFLLERIVRRGFIWQSYEEVLKYRYQHAELPQEVLPFMYTVRYRPYNEYAVGTLLICLL